MIKAIAIDDEPLALDIVKNFCARSGKVQLVEAYDNAIFGKQAIEAYKPDLIFIDIEMPALNGLQLAAGLEHRPLVIFTTAYKQFAFDGFELEAVDYLLKPFSFERFEKALNKALRSIEKMQSAANQYLLVYADYRMVKVMFDDILYLESMDDYIKIYLKDGKSILTLITLKKILDRLPASHFMKVHRSYIVSLSQIFSLLGRRLKLVDGTEIPVSESHIHLLLQLMKPS